MNYILDSLFSTVLGGFIIFMMVELNTNISASSFEMLSGQMAQANAVQSGEVLEYDLYKIGYRATGEKIVIADSTTIKFLSDIDNNSAMDSVRYYLGNKSELPYTTNPNDMPLYRKLNNNNAEMIGTTTSFSLTYFDSSGAQLKYQDLKNSTERRKIRSIKTSILFEATEPHNSAYQAVDFSRVIRPKNLNY